MVIDLLKPCLSNLPSNFKCKYHFQAIIGNSLAYYPQLLFLKYFYLKLKYPINILFQ